MSDIPVKAAAHTLLRRARLELAAAAKVVEAAATGKAIKWEELFSGEGSFGLIDQACNGNTSCRSNDACK